MIINNEDTITAIATPSGIGGIAIVRISGTKIFDILKNIFNCKKDISALKPWKVYLGKIKDNGKEIDEVLITIFKAPNSYTKENMVEISCHGGIYVSKRILELIIKNGARLAEPGEFTKRAFLNGRIDLSQAEAIADLIHTKTERGLQASIIQIEGKLYKKIQKIQDVLINICSLLEIELDFSEEDLEFVKRNDIIIKFNNVIEELNRLINSYKTGKIFRDGVKLVIIGKPNVGKSSLLNALLKEDRAIVTDIPGTTRDTLEEQLDINGILFNVIDTAGISKTDDIIEKKGIIRTQKYIENADIIVHIFDSSRVFSKEDNDIVENIFTIIKSGKVKVIAVLNKIDLAKKIELNKIKYFSDKIKVIELSAIKNIGIDKLENELTHVLSTNINKYEDMDGDVCITKVRHLNAIIMAKKNLLKSIETIKKNMSSEFITIDLRCALDNLGEIIGTVTTEDILNNIFESFCIGK